MTAIADFCTIIRSWLNRKDLTDPVLTSIVRMAEERLNEELRIREMVVVTSGIDSSSGVVDLPADWLETELIRHNNGRDLRYIPKTDMFSFASSETYGKYTTSGPKIYIGGDNIAGDVVELHYIAKVPVLSASPTWLSIKFPSLYLSAALVMASALGFEDDRAAAWEANTSTKIAKLNEKYVLSKAAGSRLTSKSSTKAGF